MSKQYKIVELAYGTSIGREWTAKVLAGELTLADALSEPNTDVRRALLHFVPNAGDGGALKTEWLIAEDAEGKLYNVPDFGRVLVVIDPANGEQTALNVSREWGDNPSQVRSATFPVALCDECDLDGWQAYPSGTVGASTGGAWCDECSERKATRWGYRPRLCCTIET